MKKILKEWNKYLKENDVFNYEKFIKEFNEIFGNAVSYDSTFFRLVQQMFNPAELFDTLPEREKNKIIRQLNSGLTHTWLMHIDGGSPGRGVEFVIGYKIDKYLKEAKPENIEYLKNNFEQFFEMLDQSSARRPDVEYNTRHVALLGQLGDWWIADDGLHIFKAMFSDKLKEV